MRRSSPTARRFIVAVIALATMGSLWLFARFQNSPATAGLPYKVHVAFGFHVNLYHSFRHDTDDENGFGQDIRVIRHIIRTLDRFNRMGIPVKGVWDFDNLFSLEQILPAYAGDIIADIRRRVQQNGDEIILMSYNNGLASAMTREELTTAMARAITNDRGSGVVDIFGKATMVVRPQEMMTTPGNFDVYNTLGIGHVALYYSATPFDAFRMFVRELSPAEAYNPVRYSHPETGESTVIIPSYHAGDLVEHVSLKHWVEKLHRMQAEGSVNRDVLIFLNFDADSEFWSGADLPWYLGWLPNTGGLAELVAAVADLDCVSFSTLGGYIEKHPPVGTVHFSQDTADGSFNGYQSWAEKSYASDLWTRIVRNRRAVAMAERLDSLPGSGLPPAALKTLKSASLETRLKALSTTNFGLAGPFLARQREAAVATISDELDRYSRHIEQMVDTAGRRYLDGTSSPAGTARYGEVIHRFLLLTPSEASAGRTREVILPFSVADSNGLSVTDAAGNRFPILARRETAGQGRAHTQTILTLGGELADGTYFISRHTTQDVDRAPDPARVSADRRMLKNDSITVHLAENGHVLDVFADGIRMLDAGSLMPFMVYEGRRITPGPMNVAVVEDGSGGSASIRISGPWAGPERATQRSGWLDYRLRLVRDLPYLYIEGEVQYPETDRSDMVQAEKPMLARKIDRSWQEVGPMELRFAPRATRKRPVRVQKRNFLEMETGYAVDYFRHDPENMDLDSINNHVTAEYAAVSAGGYGMTLAMNTAVRANFAFCPLKIGHDPNGPAFTVTANPFGTYDGRQHVPPTRGNRLGYEATVLSGPQFRSAAPTFNGYRNRFAVKAAFYKGENIPGSMKADLIGFARPVTVISDESTEEAVADRQAAGDFPAGLMALPYEGGVVFHWERASDHPDVRYRLAFRSGDGTVARHIVTRETTVHVKHVSLGKHIPCTATIAAIGRDDRDRISPEIRFTLNSGATPLHATVPPVFKLKIIWASVSAWLQHNLL